MLTFPFISTHCQIPYLFDVFIAYKNKCKGNLKFCLGQPKMFVNRQYGSVSCMISVFTLNSFKILKPL